MSRVSDWVWFNIIATGLGYEFMAILFGQELLSKATDRYRDSHPIAFRVIVFAVLGHLVAIVPPAIDIFSEKNLVHAFVCRHWRRYEKTINRITKATLNV